MSSDSAPATLTWDLSQGHTTRDVDWPGNLSAFALENGARVRVTLPEGKVFEDEVRKVSGYRQGETIKNLYFSYPAASIEDAYLQAKRLGAEWRVDLNNIDAWYARRLAQRRLGKEDYSDTAFTGTPNSEPLGGPGGPAPGIEIFNSFNRSRPVVVSFSFYWTS